MVFSSLLLQKLWSFIDKESYLLAIARRNAGVCCPPLSHDAIVSPACEIIGVNVEFQFILVKSWRKYGFLFFFKGQVSIHNWRLFLLILIRRGSSKEMGLAEYVGQGKITCFSLHLSDKLSGWKSFFLPFFFLIAICFPMMFLYWGGSM